MRLIGYNNLMYLDQEAYDPLWDYDDKAGYKNEVSYNKVRGGNV